MQTNYRVLLSIPLVFVLCTSCTSQKNKESDNWHRFFEYTSIKKQEAIIIKDSKTWAQYTENAFANQSADPTFPPIDFKKESIIWIAMGEKNTGGYKFDYYGYHYKDDSVIVAISSPKRDPMNPVTMAFTSPLMVVTIPATNATEVVLEFRNK